MAATEKEQGLVISSRMTMALLESWSSSFRVKVKAIEYLLERTFTFNLSDL